MRRFRDEAGTDWEVHVVSSDALTLGRRDFLPVAFRDGWLLFASADAKRRLAPIPGDWERLAETDLRELLARAQWAVHPELRGATSGEREGNQASG